MSFVQNIKKNPDRKSVSYRSRRDDGNNARGSRYNSTKAYTEWVRDVKYPGITILGVVKSEDGMIDFFDETKGSKNVNKSFKSARFLKSFRKFTIDISKHL